MRGIGIFPRGIGAPPFHLAQELASPERCGRSLPRGGEAPRGPRIRAERVRCAPLGGGSASLSFCFLVCPGRCYRVRGCVWLKRGDPPTPSAPSGAPAPPVRLSAPALSGAEGHKEGDPLLAERRGFVTTTPGLSAVSGQRDRVKEPCVNIQLVARPRSHVRPGRGPDLCVSVAFRSGWRSRSGNTP